MIDEVDFCDDSDFGVQAVEFTRQVARDLYRAGFGSSDLIARWDRIRSELRFEDVVEEVHGTTDPVIRCPFHGRDSRPSFYLYKRSNDGYCFGCPEGEKYYDSVRFVSAVYGYSRLQAISWIEKNFDLPPLEGEDEDDDDEDEDDVLEGVKTIPLNFHDLSEPYIARAAAAFLESRDPDLIRDYIELFFDALPERDTDPNTEEELRKARPLGRVLGPDILEEIKQKKATI